MVLVLALVFLLLLTIMGITALNTTSLEEKMTGNVKDRNLAFQAAESALILAESWIYAQIGKPIFPSNATGLYLPDNGVSGDPDGVDNWNENIWAGANVVTYPNTPGASGSGALGKINSQPRYIIEDMGEKQESGGSIGMTSNHKSTGLAM
jgi:type IV pilus assembly protein PilX